MLEALGTLVVATLLILGSPGPAPLALAATGAVFGVRAGVPFLCGILSGLVMVISISATGLAALFNAFPASRLIVGVAGALYVLYVAAKVATAPISADRSRAATKAPGIRDGFIFNLLNPKAYAAFLALLSQFQLPAGSAVISTAATGAVAFLVAIFVDVVWLLAGGLLRPLFENPRTARATRVIFAILMVAAVAFTFRDTR